LLARVVVLVVAFTVHEFAHAWTADYLGDDTPRLQGRLTLNPLAHLDFLGSLLLLVVGFGWAKPVQVYPNALRQRSPAAPMLVALAGPVSNLFLALAAAIPVQAGLIQATRVMSGTLPSLGLLVSEFVLINLLLMLFNLIPVFPLDGEKVLTFFLPAEGQQIMARIRPYGQFILLGIIFLVPSVLNLIIFRPTLALYGLLIG
jgi:Zn-dependent protease